MATWDCIGTGKIIYTSVPDNDIDEMTVCYIVSIRQVDFSLLSVR